MPKKKRGKKKLKGRLSRDSILRLVNQAEQGDSAALSKLDGLMKDKKSERRIHSILEEERTKHLRGYRGRDNANPLNLNMWPYRK